MALQLLETLNQTLTAYTGLSPTTFFTVLALGVAVYYAVSGIFGGSSNYHLQQRSRSLEEDMQPLPPPVQLGEISEEELRAYDGNDPKKPLLMAIKGQIYDVSQSRMFYGPGGPYALFAGKDASRALAKMSFDDKDLNGDLTGLGAFELEALQDWEYKFMSKYVKVGTIKKPETAPEAEVSAADEPAESTITHESTAAHPAAEPTVTQSAESTAAGSAEPKAATDVAKPAEEIPSENGTSETKEEVPTTVEAKKEE